MVHDVQEALDQLTPPDRHYAHNDNLRDGNGHSHVRAGLVGPSLTVPFVDGPPHAGPLPDHRLLRLRRAAPASAELIVAGDGRMSDASG